MASVEKRYAQENVWRYASDKLLYFLSGGLFALILIGGYYHDHIRYHFNVVVDRVASRKAGNNDTQFMPLSREDETLWEEMKKLLRKFQQQPNDRTPHVFSGQCQENRHACTMPCDKPLDQNAEVRLKKLLFHTKLRLSQQQRENILSIGQAVPENDVIIATAVSSNHFYEMQAMFHNLHTKVYPTLKNFSVVVFDIGLSEAERKLTEAKCKCQVVVFPKERFPPHVRNNLCYGWKPLIVLAMIKKARKVLIWQDSSIRWLKDIKVYINRTEKYGEQYVRYAGSSFLPANTVKQTFDFMEEKPCAFTPFPEIGGNIHLHKNDPLIKKAILEPWARCALEASCLCPANPPSIIRCSKTKIFHRCHRFDQSAMTIITAMFYNQDYYKVVTLEEKYEKPIYVTPRRGNRKDYFAKS